MSRKLFTLTAVAAIAFAAPASAGTLAYQNGVATWEATGCPTPTAPSYMDPSSGGKTGNSLSANVEAYNQYTQAVQQFLNCISAEANQDLAAISQQVGNQIQQVQAAWQADLARRNADMQTKRGQ